MSARLSGKIDSDALRTIKSLEEKNRDLEGRLSIAEKTIDAQRKEIIVLQRQLGAPNKLTVPKKYSTDENSLFEKKESVHDTKNSEDLLSKNAELVDCVRKQAKYIDVLKRQKMLLEAGLLLSFSEKELAQLIDQEQW